MLIDMTAGWAIITPPKTGSTSLRHHFVDKYSGAQHDADLPATFRGHVYVTTRNPYARAVSLWQHRLWDRAHEEKLRGPRELISRVRFMDFLEELPTLGEFFQPASWWIRQVPEPYGLLRLETLEQSLRRIGLMTEEQALPVLNKTRHEPINGYYEDPEAKWRVVQHFAEDFNRFQYSTEITRDTLLV